MSASREIAEYYRPRRSIPVQNVCTLRTTSEEEIDWSTYEQQIERPIADCLRKNGLQETTLYIVTTERIYIRKGILSRQDHSTTHARVQNVNSTQGILDRVNRSRERNE